jgi:hypothetical protein
MICGKVVEGPGRVGYICQEEGGHSGPCAAPEVPRSVSARRRWSDEQDWIVVPPTKTRPEDQVLPRPADGPVMHDEVAGDLAQRLALGLQRYGQPLRAFNGRNACQDAYEEVLDLSVYLKQMTLEWNVALTLLARWADGSADPGLIEETLTFLDRVGVLGPVGEDA